MVNGSGGVVYEYSSSTTPKVRVISMNIESRLMFSMAVAITSGAKHDRMPY